MNYHQIFVSEIIYPNTMCGGWNTLTKYMSVHKTFLRDLKQKIQITQNFQ